MSITINKIPHQIKKVKRWVTWRYEIRDGKATKVPYSKTGHRASSTNPDTWCSFDEAVNSAKRYRANGIGIVLGDGLTGFDFDWKEWEGEGIPPSVQMIISVLDSFAEFSPSGKGIHVLVWGTKPEWAQSRTVLEEGVVMEVYSSGRYFTCTGNHVTGTPDEIQHRDDEIAKIAEIFLKPAPAATPAPVTQPAVDRVTPEFVAQSKVAPLWQGDISGYASHSEADLALAGFLMWATGNNEEEADRLFRQSGLYRPKWDRPMSSSSSLTYGQATLKKAMATRIREEKAPRPAVKYAANPNKPVNLKDLLDPTEGWESFDFAALQILGLKVTRDGRLAIPYQNDMGGNIIGAVTIARNLTHNGGDARGIWIYEGDNPAMAHVSSIPNAPALWIGLDGEYGSNAFVGVGKDGLTERAAQWLAGLNSPIVLWFESNGEEYRILEVVKNQLVNAGVSRDRIIIPGDDFYGREILWLGANTRTKALRSRLLNAKAIQVRRSWRREAMLSVAIRNPKQWWTLPNIKGRLGIWFGRGRLKTGSAKDLETAEFLSDLNLYSKAAKVVGSPEQAQMIAAYAYAIDMRVRNAIRYRLFLDGKIPMTRTGANYCMLHGKRKYPGLKNMSTVDLMAEVVAEYAAHFRFHTERAFHEVMRDRHTFWKFVAQTKKHLKDYISRFFPFYNRRAVEALGVCIV